jgi:hypothetical protein
MGGRREKDFSMALSDLGKPDQDFDYPGFAKWIVQEPAGKRFERRLWYQDHEEGA